MNSSFFKTAASLVVLASVSFSSAAFAQTAPSISPSVLNAIAANADDDQGCANAVLDAARAQANLQTTDADRKRVVGDIAGLGTTTCGAGATGGIASSLAREFPSDASEIAVAMTKANNAAVAEIVVSIVTTFPQSQQQRQYNSIIAALKAGVPGIDNQEAFAALSIPGAPPLPGAAAPDAGLLGFDVISPS